MTSTITKQIEYTIEESISVLSSNDETGYSLELNKISYDSKEAKYDLRKWRKTKNGKRLLKGVTFDFGELKALHAALSEYLEDHGKE